MNDLSCGIIMWIQVYFVLSQFMRLTDRHTDRQTDIHMDIILTVIQALARTNLHRKLFSFHQLTALAMRHDKQFQRFNRLSMSGEKDDRCLIVIMPIRERYVHCRAYNVFSACDMNRKLTI